MTPTLRSRVFPTLAVLGLTVVVLEAGPQAPPSVSYVQATIVDANPTAGTLGFVTASGRSRVARIEGAARARVPNLRAGDEVILSLAGSAERPTITGVKVSRLAPAAPAPDPAVTVATPAMVTGVSSRPSWPNPYSRINPGLPFRPARTARAAGIPGGGTLSVMPAGLVTSAGSGSPPNAAPAVAPPVARAPLPAPAAPVGANDASTVEGLRAGGARDFEAAVSRLAAEARAVDAVYARYRSACPTSGAAEGPRGWLDIKGAAAMGAGDASCAVLVEEIQRLGAPIKVGMLAAHEAARRAWVLPGTLREVRRRHDMDWSGWDR